MRSKYYIVFLLKVIPMSILAAIAIILAIPYLLLNQELSKIIAQYIKDVKSIRYSFYLKNYKL